jgi:hypothetical protein
MNQMNNIESDYHKKITELYVVCSDAIMYWCVFMKVKDFAVNNDNQKVHRFLQATQSANYSAFTIELNKLIGKSGVSIFEAKDYLKSYSCIFGQTKESTNKYLKEIDAKLAIHKTVIKNIINQRNRFHIHIDKEDINDSSTKVHVECPVEYSELELLLRSICECLEIFVKVLGDDYDRLFFESTDESYIHHFLFDQKAIAVDLNLMNILNSLKNLSNTT